MNSYTDEDTKLNNTSSLFAAGVATPPPPPPSAFVGGVGVGTAVAMKLVNVRFQWSHALFAPLALGSTSKRSGRRIFSMVLTDRLFSKEDCGIRGYQSEDI